MSVRIKKTEKSEKSEFSDAEQRRYDEIVRIQTYLEQGYSPTTIRVLLHTTYNRIRRYAKGDPYKMCRFIGKSCKRVNYEDYREEIINYLRHNISFKNICARITVDGYNGKPTQVRKYCRKLIAELGLEHTSKKNSAGVYIKKNQNINVHYVSSRDVFDYIWSDKELDLQDILYIMGKYPHVFDILQCVRDFRNIYIEKSIVLLRYFATVYSFSPIKQLKSFASGLLRDYDAVKNSVMSELSNGFVEGVNNRIKVIKRIMYGRAKLSLLAAKILHST